MNTLPAGLHEFEGCLYRNGSVEPIRTNYSQHHREIRSVADLKATLRAGPFAWPGGYPLYFITSDGEALSFEAARAEFRLLCAAIRENDTRGGWHVCACEVNYEDGDLVCAHTGKAIESAYATPSKE